MLFEAKQVAKSMIARTLPPRLSLNLQFLRVHGRFPNLRNPQTFSEKVQWRKLNDRNPRFAPMMDKISVKEFVSKEFGPEWVTPSLWTGTHVTADILRGLPKPFVIKPSHTSGYIEFVTDEGADLEAVATQANTWTKYVHHPQLLEWGYGDIPPRLLVEPFIGEENAPPLDYKFFVFNGQVRMVQVDTDRFIGHKRSFYDPQWKKLPFGMGYPVEPRDIPAPTNFEKMKEFANRMCSMIANDFVRVDLYELDGAPFFGEVTFYPEAGFKSFMPPSYDQVVGGYWSLPRKVGT